MTKTRNIARAGGKMAIIMDTKEENITKISMSDDGTGAGIRIPAVLIGKSDGAALQKWIKNADGKDDDVQLNVQFMSPHPVEKAELKFWYTSSDARSLMFLQNLRHYMATIFNEVEFKPMTVNWDC